MADYYGGEVTVGIEGKTYTAANNGDHIWTLAAGVIDLCPTARIITARPRPSMRLLQANQVQLACNTPLPGGSGADCQARARRRPNSPATARANKPQVGGSGTVSVMGSGIVAASSCQWPVPAKQSSPWAHGA